MKTLGIQGSQGQSNIYVGEPLDMLVTTVVTPCQLDEVASGSQSS